jgi:formate dehydrogenase iron-sulfur subunit
MATHKAMLIDITMCIGCNTCQDACKRENKLPGGAETRLSPTAFTVLEEHDGITVRRLCQHCEAPTCASVCPVGALTKTTEGPVVYDATKCIGCRYCIQACPFQVPRYEWSSTYPRVRKCRFCYERVRNGQQTACAEACPTGATKFGTRDGLIREAFARIQAEPGKYVNRIYGQGEVGGTSILYITSVPFEQLGFKTRLGTDPLPELTINVLSKIPTVVTVGGAFLAGIYWITNRREEVRRAEGQKNGRVLNSEPRRPTS